MFGNKGAIENTMLELMMKKDKYRLNCRYCIKVTNSPVEMAFCKFGCSEREVHIIIGCQSDCGMFEEMAG
jgi:hypothetical protein